MKNYRMEVVQWEVGMRDKMEHHDIVLGKFLTREAAEDLAKCYLYGWGKGWRITITLYEDDITIGVYQNEAI